MKKFSYKKIALIILLVLTIASISTVSFAQLTQINPVVGPGHEQIKSISAIVIGVIQVIAAVVAVVILVVLAMKYMTGAPSDKADIKKSFIIWVVGDLILFAGSAILGIIQSIADGINNPNDGGGVQVQVQAGPDGVTGTGTWTT